MQIIPFSKEWVIFWNTLYLAENDFILWVSDLDVHAYLWAAGGEPVGPGVVQLHLNKRHLSKLNP